MIVYVVDTCVMRELMFHIRRSVFPDIWEKFEFMIASSHVIFARESIKELELQFSYNGEAMMWLKAHRNYFLPPSNEEAMIVSQIYSVRNFQNNVALKSILEGRPVADAFIVAKAKALGATVVTREKFTTNAARIPNICEYLDVDYIDDEAFQLLLR